jgi:hypothetical protein
MKRSWNWLFLLTGLVWLFWATRIVALDAFPPFLDEGQHVDEVERTARTSPLAFANEGRLFTFWWLAPFQPQAAATVWVSRAAVVLITLLGFAASISLGRLTAGLWGAGLTALILGFSVYHYFFGRMALADPLSASAVQVALYFVYRLSRRGQPWIAVLAGAALFVAVGFKVTALPFYSVPVVAALPAVPIKNYWRQHIKLPGLALGVALGLTAVFTLGLRVFGYNPFALALLYNASTSESLFARLTNNITLTFDVWAGYFSLPVLALLLCGVLYLLSKRRFFLPLCLLLPLLALWVQQRQGSRYLIAHTSILLLCGAAALALLVQKRSRRVQFGALSLVFAWGLAGWLPFAWTTARNPAAIALPQTDMQEYVWSDASGYGLREVYTALKEQGATRVLGIMSNCWGLRYMAQRDLPVECTDINPNGSTRDTLEQKMRDSQVEGVYVVLESLPFVPSSSPGKLITVIQRPGNGPTLSIYHLAP